MRPTRLAGEQAFKIAQEAGCQEQAAWYPDHALFLPGVRTKQAEELSVGEVVASQQIAVAGLAQLDGIDDALAYIIDVHEVLATGRVPQEFFTDAMQQEFARTRLVIARTDHERGVHHHGWQLPGLYLLQYVLLCEVF